MCTCTNALIWLFGQKRRLVHSILGAKSFTSRGVLPKGADFGDFEGRLVHKRPHLACESRWEFRSASPLRRLPRATFSMTSLLQIRCRLGLFTNIREWLACRPLPSEFFRDVKRVSARISILFVFSASFGSSITTKRRLSRDSFPDDLPFSKERR